jgi:hypothetical protein
MNASRNQLLITGIVCISFAAILLGWIIRPTLESVVQVFR